MLTFTVRLIRNGVIRKQITVDAREAIVVGNYHNGIPYQPNTDQVIASMPRTYHKAIQRHVTWWASNSTSLPLAMNLYTTDRKPMGTLFATADWV
jgi:hypothetical protein